MTNIERVLRNEIYTTEEPTQEAPTRLDNRLVQETNRSQILLYLSRFGWLTCRMLADLVWQHAAQPITMARRTLAPMVEEKLVFTRQLSKGGAAYFLSAKGAGLLRLEGFDAQSGYTLSVANPIHRACSNWFLIRAIKKGLVVYTEHEIATGRAPRKVVNDKLPDGLIVADNGQCIWVECEYSQKSRSERHRVVGFAKAALGRSERIELGPDLYLARLAIVGSNQHALRWMAQSVDDTRRYGGMTESQLAEVDVCLLTLTDSLVPGDVFDGNLY
ncbi:hypothetical protein [Undibacterium sp. Xuan67W]|uniref:hypothetical protein n=1 Tax=Undibacterium sp. Xuan67W TaxID=3413057 RepID=UPI003BF2B239